MIHQKVDTSLNFVDRERAITEFWKRNGIFEKSTAQNEGGKDFVFYDGPPTANGKPHIGHILTRVMKDIIPRYRTMKGYHIERKAGWGYSRSAGGAGGGEAAGDKRQAADRKVRH